MCVCLQVYRAASAPHPILEYGARKIDGPNILVQVCLSTIIYYLVIKKIIFFSTQFKTLKYFSQSSLCKWVTRQSAWNIPFSFSLSLSFLSSSSFFSLYSSISFSPSSSFSSSLKSFPSFSHFLSLSVSSTSSNSITLAISSPV